MVYLSIVATSRNDDHGGDPLIRTQIFINSLALQCEKYNLSAELVLVDWNPVRDRPGLAEVLRLPDNCEYLKTRVITVPAELHRKYKYSDKLPLFQMIAKNVGIRRAYGEYVVATNIDIIFSDELMSFISSKKLDPRNAYRIDRYDIRNGLSQFAPYKEIQEYAWSNVIRAHRRYHPEVLINKLYGDDLFKRDCNRIEPDSFEEVELIHNGTVQQIMPNRSARLMYIHTNACGDFTLLSNEGWNAIRGYPEFESYSFNIDSMGLVTAHYGGYTEVSLLPPCVCFHIEHSVGSGWTPEGGSVLFNRLRESDILTPEWPVVEPFVDEMRDMAKAIKFNNTGWGLEKYDLVESRIGDADRSHKDLDEVLVVNTENCRVSSIQPEYDLDRLTLMYERRFPYNPESYDKAILLVPDDNGKYDDENSIACDIGCNKISKIVFHVERYSRQFPLRLDPCESSGTIEIFSIKALDITQRKLILDMQNISGDDLKVGGTAQLDNPVLLDKVDENGSDNLITETNLFSVVKRALLTQRPGVRHLKALMPLGFKIRLKKYLIGNQNSIESNIVTEQQKINESKHFRILSWGLDPQVYLPKISENTGFPLLLTIEMKFTPFK